MSASKSAQLIMEWYGHRQHNKETLVFKPKLDTRDVNVKSRALDTEIPADLLVEEGVLGEMFDRAMNTLPRVIYVDEIQFFNKEQIEELARIVDIIGVTVIAYGLMTTFKGELFEGSKRLVELADVVERIRTECTRCQNEGIMNGRFVDGKLQLDGETVLVGAEETYTVLCRRCFMKESGGI
jgi:thymidine kinase